MLDCDIIGSKLHYDTYIQKKTLGKGMDPLIPSIYELK